MRSVQAREPRRQIHDVARAYRSRRTRGGGGRGLLRGQKEHTPEVRRLVRRQGQENRSGQTNQQGRKGVPREGPRPKTAPSRLRRRVRPSPSTEENGHGRHCRKASEGPHETAAGGRPRGTANSRGGEAKAAAGNDPTSSSGGGPSNLARAEAGTYRRERRTRVRRRQPPGAKRVGTWMRHRKRPLQPGASRGWGRSFAEGEKDTRQGAAPLA